MRFLEDLDGVPTGGAFSPDGTSVAVISGLGEVQILDVLTGRRVRVAMGFEGAVPVPVIGAAGRVTWSEDGEGIWIGTLSGPVRFVADPVGWREIACGMVHRELTAEEWRTFVSPTEPPVASCP